ncbi:hypothetical protein TNCV_319211 [Trichonephila clavipes]|nr:hypothetical protein TNCV_2714681 [Trichonephila clavipes]GFU62420.1 hypothetical protein TNCV_319211 [Trichonephila clavipes]
MDWPWRSSALASPIARPFLSGLFLLGANEIFGVRNTRKQRRGTCSTHQCSSRGNTKHSRNVIECSTLHMKRRCEACITCGGGQFEHLL